MMAPSRITVSRPCPASQIVSLFVWALSFASGAPGHARGQHTARHVVGLVTSRTGDVEDGDDLVPIGFVNSREAATSQPAAAKSTPDSHLPVLRPAEDPEGLVAVA
jgi:hypothetical protein